MSHGAEHLELANVFRRLVIPACQTRKFLWPPCPWKLTSSFPVATSQILCCSQVLEDVAVNVRFAHRP